MSKITKEQSASLDRVVKQVSKGQFENFAEMSKVLQSKTISTDARNEWLYELAGVLSKQITIDTISTKINIPNNWFKDGMEYGELEQIRQVLFAKRGMYSEFLDVNDHYKPRVVEEYVSTNKRDRYEVSISTNILKNAYLSAQGFMDFANEYNRAISKTTELTWSQRKLEMMVSTPIVYKLDMSKDSKEIAQELGLLLKKITLITPFYNEEGLPVATNKDDMLVVMSTALKNKIDYEVLQAVFQEGFVDGELKNVKFIDFGDNGETQMFIGDKNLSFWIDSRLNESTIQSWAKTLIQDSFLHQWFRMVRIGMVNTVRVVDKEKFGDKIKLDWKKSPFTKYTYADKSMTGKPTGIVKDDADIIDITEKVKLDIGIPQGYEIDLETAINILPSGIESTAVAVKEFLINNNIELTNENFNVISVTPTEFVVQAVKGLTNVNSYKDTIKYTWNGLVPGGKVNKDEEINEVKKDEKN